MRSTPPPRSTTAAASLMRCAHHSPRRRSRLPESPVNYSLAAFSSLHGAVVGRARRPHGYVRHFRRRRRRHNLASSVLVPNSQQRRASSRARARLTAARRELLSSFFFSRSLYPSSSIVLLRRPTSLARADQIHCREVVATSASRAGWCFAVCAMVHSSAPGACL